MENPSESSGKDTGICSRVNRRVMSSLWGLSFCKPQDPYFFLYYSGESS